MTTITEVLDRIEALETRKLELEDLPMPELRREVLTSQPSDPTEILLPKSVGAPLLKDDAVGNAQIANNSVGAAEIVDGSVGAAEIVDGSVGTLEAPTFVNSTVETLKVIRGTINTAGAGTIVVGSGFTITRNSIGNVTVNFSDSFSTAPTVTLGVGNNANVTGVHVSGPTTSSCRVVLLVPSTGGNSEGTFHFTAIGPR